MEFNFLPTDNLYKFSAIVGLFLIAFNFYYSNNKIDELGDESIKLLVVLDKQLDLQNRTITNMQALSKHLNDIKSHQTSAIAAGNELVKEGNKKGYIGESNKEKKLLNLYKTENAAVDSGLAQEKYYSDKVEKAKDDLEEVQLQVNQLRYEYDLKNHRVEYYERLLRYCSILGIIISTWGFWNWFKFQKIQDKSFLKPS